MRIKVFIIFSVFILASCVTKHPEMEICFEHVKTKLKSDSILEKLKNSPIDSHEKFGSIIHRAVIEDSKYDSICPKSLDQYFERNNYSVTVNNLMLFQQFQAYLKHHKFDESKAMDSALRFERKWKGTNFTGLPRERVGP